MFSIQLKKCYFLRRIIKTFNSLKPRDCSNVLPSLTQSLCILPSHYFYMLCVTLVKGVLLPYVVVIGLYGGRGGQDYRGIRKTEVELRGVANMQKIIAQCENKNS